MARQQIPLREIAVHAGVSDATVDRVLHARGGVRATTAARVRRAVAELERQQAAFELGGRTFTIDLVMHTPRRFSDAVRAAFDAVVPTLRPAVFKVRPHLYESISAARTAKALDDIGRRGSQAVVVKASDVPAVNEAVDRLVADGVPVFTLVTDLPTSARLAYVGIDNRAAGATAAYLIGRWMGDHGRAPHVLVTMSSLRFRGEEEREAGFRAVARSAAPAWRLFDVAETDGLDGALATQVGAIAKRHRIDAVYSIGGGNKGVLSALDRYRRAPDVYVAHDLDAENTRLLVAERISAVLHHDLRADARRVCELVMQAHGAVPGRPVTQLAPVHVVTPYNLP